MNTLQNQQQLEDLKHGSDVLLVLFGGEHCGVCQTIKPQIEQKFSAQFPDLVMAYIDCEQLQEVCAQCGVFSLPVVQVFFMGQKFIEEVRGFSLLDLQHQIEKTLAKMQA